MDSGADSCDIGLLRERLALGTSNPKHRDATIEVLNNLPLQTTSAENVAKSLTDLRKRNLGFELAACLSSGMGGHDRALQLMEQYRELALISPDKKEGSVLNQVSLSELRDKLTGDGLLRVAPSNLGRAVGKPLIGGHHVVVFGRPNKGKSAFAINLAAQALVKGLRVLYVENEDVWATTMVRVLSRLTEQPESELFAEGKDFMPLAFERGYANFFLKDMHPGTYREVRAVAEEVKPDIIFLNQIRNFSTKDLARHEMLEYCAINGRNLAKSLDCIVVSITQAGDSATGKLILTPEDVDSSKTGVQAAVDLMIGIGSNNELEQRGLVMLTICKNKLTPNHTSVQARLEPLISKLSGVS